MAARPRPNSVEYSNSKTTTLLPSAICTRALFQGRTGCGGHPPGWHDIIICQRLVFFFFCTSWAERHMPLYIFALLWVMVSTGNFFLLLLLLLFSIMFFFLFFQQGCQQWWNVWGFSGSLPLCLILSSILWANKDACLGGRYARVMLEAVFTK